VDRRQKIHADVRPSIPLFYRAKGRTVVQPLVMRQSGLDEYTSWPTDEGYLYIARVDRHADHFIQIVSRIKANGSITVPPAYLPPTPKISPDVGVLFFGSNDGFVTAIREDGVVLWQFPTGDPIVQPPVSIGERVYISTHHGGLHCVDAIPDAAGRVVKHWYAPGALQFLAASKKHVYAADKSGNTLVLDAASGDRVDTLDTSKLTVKLMNDQTDRLYLATPDGLVQCLREIGAKEPLHYDLERKQAEESAKPVEKKGKAGEESPFEKKAAEKAPAKESKKAEAKKGEEPAPADDAAAEDKQPEAEKPAAEEKKPAAEEKKPEAEKPAAEAKKPAEKKPEPDAGGDNPFEK
jgi:hypothetical protein